MVGGFKYVLFESLFGEESHFGLIFFKGVETTNQITSLPTFNINFSENVGDNIPVPWSNLGDSNRRSFAQRVAPKFLLYHWLRSQRFRQRPRETNALGRQVSKRLSRGHSGRGSLGFSLGCLWVVFFGSLRKTATSLVDVCFMCFCFPFFFFGFLVFIYIFVCFTNVYPQKIYTFHHFSPLKQLLHHGRGRSDLTL